MIRPLLIAVIVVAGIAFHAEGASSALKCTLISGPESGAGRTVLSCPPQPDGSKVIITTDWGSGEWEPSDSIVEVISKGKSHQTVIPALILLGEGRDEVILDDIDCDGYYDIRKQIDHAQHNDVFEIWRYSVSRHVFVLDAELSALSDPRPFPGCRCYWTYSYGGNAGGNFDYAEYCREGGKLKKKRDLSQRSIRGKPENELSCHVRDTRIDKAGRETVRTSERCTEPPRF